MPEIVAPVFVRTDTEFERMKEDHGLVLGCLRLTEGANLLVVGSVVTVTHSFHRIQSFGSDLLTILGGQQGQVLVLRGNTTVDFHVRDGDNIALQRDCRMRANDPMALTLMFDTGFWYELGRTAT